MKNLDVDSVLKYNLEQSLQYKVQLYFFEMFDNKEKTYKLYNLFIKNINKLCIQIEKDVKEKNNESLRKNLHSLKGVLLNGGLNKKGLFVQNVENQVKNGINWQEIETEVKNIVDYLFN